MHPDLIKNIQNIEFLSHSDNIEKLNTSSIKKAIKFLEILME